MKIVKKKSEPSDLYDQIELSKNEYSSEHLTTVDTHHLRWKFLECPYEAAEATLMYDGKNLVGRSMRQLRPFHLTNCHQILRGATVSDLLIAEKSRNALSTLNLIKKGSDLSDIDLILHGSNEFSYPLYAKLLKYPIAFSLTLKAVPIRIAGPLKKMTGFGPSFLDALLIPLHVLLLLSAKTLGVLSNVRLSDDKINDDDLQIIHDDFRKIAGPHFKRDTPFFNWRYKTGPIFNAKVIGIRKGKNILGYVAIKRLNFEGLALGLVIDLQLRRNLTFLERIALRIGILAEHLNHKADVVAILANFKNPVLSQIFRFPFINIPDSYLPHPNPIFVLSKIKDEKLIDELKNTYYTLSDLDYF